MYYVVCPTNLIRTSQLFVVFLEHADLIHVHLNGAAISITLIDSPIETGAVLEKHNKLVVKIILPAAFVLKISGKLDFRKHCLYRILSNLI